MNLNKHSKLSGLSNTKQAILVDDKEHKKLPTTTENHQFSGQPVSSLRSSHVKWEINPSKTSMMIMRIHYAFLVDEIPKNKRSGDSKQTIQYIMSKVCLPEMCRSAFDLLFFVGFIST